MRHFILFSFVGVFLTGCGPNREGWETVDGERVWMEGNCIVGAELTDEQVVWSTHSGIKLNRYFYRWEGPPVMMHVWYDLNQDNKQISLPILSALLFDREYPGRNVKEKGVILISRRREISATERTLQRSITIQVKDHLAMTFPLPLEASVPDSWEAANGSWATNNLEIGKTYDKEAIVYRDLKNSSEQENISIKDNPECIFKPGAGKTILTLRVRFSPFDPKQEFTTVRRDGSTERMAYHAHSLGMILYHTDDRQEPGA